MTKTITETVEFFGEGDSRLKLELLDDGAVQVRRWTWNADKNRWTPHRFTISPDAALAETAALSDAEKRDRRMIPAAAIARIEAHRTPARLAVGQARKAAREAEGFLQQ